MHFKQFKKREAKNLQTESVNNIRPAEATLGSNIATCWAKHLQHGFTWLHSGTFPADRDEDKAD